MWEVIWEGITCLILGLLALMVFSALVVVYLADTAPLYDENEREIEDDE